MSKPVLPRVVVAPPLENGPHSEPYRPFRLPGDTPPPGPFGASEAYIEADRHEQLLEQSQLGGIDRWSGFYGYGSNAGPTPEQQAYARALAGGLPDDAAPMPEPPSPFRVTS